MRLFSEKVEPTFTSSNLNILTVKEFVEVFFDVFEFEINGKKFIAEKVADYRGFPVVDVPLVLEGKELTAPFVLQKGKFEILFNPDLATIVGEAVEESIEPIIEVTEKAEEIEEIVLEKKETILQEIAQAKQSAAKYVEKLKQQKLEEAAQYFEDKQKAFEAELQESKKGLLDEFLGLVENVKSEVFTFNQEEKDKLKTFIESSINHLSSKLSKSIDSKQESAEEKFSEQINELANKVLSGVLLKEITRNNEKSTKDINTRFESISKSLETLVDNKSKLIIDGVSNTLNEFSETITTLEKANVEINDQINKTNNKALSRIGNVKTQLEESIIDTTNTLIEKIETAESRIKDYYDTKITLIEERVEGITDENKSYFIGLINESRQSLLNELSNIKVDVPNIVIEKANGKQEVDLKGIKTELEKVIGTRFSNELQSLKRLIEMSSGGGSVAKQFANGGTMDGNLTVVGTISAQSYAGIPNPDLTQYLPISGGTVTGNLTVNGTLSTTLLEALSANITVIDIKQYELSGFNVTGNATVQGSISATGDLTVHKRLNFAGDANGANNLYFFNYGSNRWKWGSNGVGDIMDIAGNNVTIGQDAYFTRQGITIRNLGETTGATLLGEAPDVLAQRRRSSGANPQTSRIYNTYTDASNYQRGIFTWLSGASAFVIGTESSTTAGVSALSGLVNPIILAPGYNQSLSATAPVILQQTWNNTNNTFTLLSANVTDNASSSSSLLMDLRVGGNSKFKVDKAGKVGIGNAIPLYDGVWLEGVAYELKVTRAHDNSPLLMASGVSASVAGRLGIGPLYNASTPQVFLYLDAANTLAQRNDTNPQEFRLYGLYAGSGANREYAYIKSLSASSFTIGTSATGTGVSRGLEFQTAGSTRMTIQSGGNVLVNNGTLKFPSRYGGTDFAPNSIISNFTTDNQLQFRGGNGTGRFRFDSADNNWDFILPNNAKVGIGTDNPLYNLHARYNSASLTRSRFENINGSNIIQIGSKVGSIASTSYFNSVVWDTGVDTDGTFKIAGPNGDVGQLTTNTRMTITSAGNVGIGGDATATFQVNKNSSTYTSWFSSGNADNWNVFSSSAGSGEYGIYQDAFYFQALNTLSNGIRFYIASSVALQIAGTTGNIGIGTTTPNEKLTVVGNISATGNATINGHLAASTKSFKIPHQTKSGYLQYGVVESDQHSVFVRGKTSDDTITLPDHWDWLVDEDSVTVQLTPIGKPMSLFVIEQNNKTVKVGGVEGNYNYTIYGTRKDVPDLIVETEE